MGSLYRPKYKDSRGNTRTSAIWWIRFHAHGKCIRQSTETADHAKAKDFLKDKESEAGKGRISRSMYRKVLFSEIAQLVEKDYELNKYKSAKDIELRHRLHIIPYFGNFKANRITESDIDSYVLHRRSEGASNATINRELTTIKRAYSLAIQKKIVSESDRPHISMLKEDNVRKGFFEPDQFKAVLEKLPERHRPTARFAYITGWRKSEILSLQWRQVDFKARTVRLEAGTTKNDESRQFHFTDELESVLLEQKEKADELAKDGKIVPYVFFYPKGKRAGRRFHSIKKAWATACEDAEIPGRLMHDFRRTAVRNLVRAGVPERVAMKMTGHKTRSVFERYNIVSEADLTEAAERLNEFTKHSFDENRQSTGKVARISTKSKKMKAAK
jgi:integrase